MVVVVVLGEVVLVANNVPPGRLASYQRTVVPLVPTPALSVNGPLPQKVVDETTGKPGSGLMITVTVTPVLWQPVVVLKVVT